MKPKRTLVIGDIHGAYKALLQILERSSYNLEEDQLIFLGDYVDGWSESFEVIDYLIEIKKLSKFKPIFLMGNHDVWCKDWLNFGTRHPYWEPQGGKATIESYVENEYYREPKNQQHKDFFNKLHRFYIDKDGNGFVHGGFTSEEGLGYELYEGDYCWNRELWQDAIINHDNFLKTKKLIPGLDKHKEIFIGHTTTGIFKVKPHYPEYQHKNQPKNGSIVVPMNRCNVWNLDTGAGYEGKLTIMDINTKEYWQSDSTKELYKNERGRN